MALLVFLMLLQIAAGSYDVCTDDIPYANETCDLQKPEDVETGLILYNSTVFDVMETAFHNSQLEPYGPQCATMLCFIYFHACTNVSLDSRLLRLHSASGLKFIDSQRSLLETITGSNSQVSNLSEEITNFGLSERFSSTWQSFITTSFQLRKSVDCLKKTLQTGLIDANYFFKCFQASDELERTSYLVAKMSRSLDTLKMLGQDLVVFQPSDEMRTLNRAIAKLSRRSWLVLARNLLHGDAAVMGNSTLFLEDVNSLIQIVGHGAAQVRKLKDGNVIP